MNLRTIGQGLAKNVFPVHGGDACGKVVLRKQFTRQQLSALFAYMLPCLMGMEACASAHH